MESSTEIALGRNNFSVVRRTDSRTGRKNASAFECYPCFAHRRHFYKKTSQADLLKKLTEDTNLKNHMETNRRSWMQGDGWASGGDDGALGRADSVVAKVEQSQGNLDEEYDEGYFYKIKDYLRLLDREGTINTIGFTDKDYCLKIRELAPGTTFYKDRDGSVGVKESNLPSGASYKFKTGRFDTQAWMQVNEWSTDLDDAHDAFNEVMDEKQQREQEEDEGDGVDNNISRLGDGDDWDEPADDGRFHPGRPASDVSSVRILASEEEAVQPQAGVQAGRLWPQPAGGRSSSWFSKADSTRTCSTAAPAASTASTTTTSSHESRPLQEPSPIDKAETEKSTDKAGGPAEMSSQQLAARLRCCRDPKKVTN